MCLRYFNAAGADLKGLSGKDTIQNTFNPTGFATASGRRNHISVYGEDYGTPDGTCVRDYIHVFDYVLRATWPLIAY